MGIQGFSPSPNNGMALTSPLSPGKARDWAARIRDFRDLGAVTRQELGSLIGELSFFRTPVFGRISRSMMAPLYGKLDAPPFHPPLSDRGAGGLHWWALGLPDIRPRVARPKADRADLIIFADAATSTMTIAAVTLGSPYITNDFRCQKRDSRAELGKHMWRNQSDIRDGDPGSHFPTSGKE